MRVMIVEDNPADVRLIEEMLREVGIPDLSSKSARTLAEAKLRLANEHYDIVLLDLGLPDSQGLDTLMAVRERADNVPVVVLTGFNDEEHALQALHLGAQDYLIKGQIRSAPLFRAIRYAIERNEISEMLNQTMRELEVRTDEMEAFTYSVSHDLKEPLRTLEAFSRFLLEDYGESIDEQGRDYLTRIGAASARLKAMIEELLTLSRLGRTPHQLERIDVRAVVEGFIDANQYSIQERNAEVIIEGDLPAVLGDLSRIEQVFGNLIGNGIKFNQNGHPIVRVSAAEQDAGMATFAVSDNGIGIDPDYHDRIFGIFQRLHAREEYEGTGAGLAIVKRATSALDGSIWVESEPGQGATFFVRLPLWEGKLRLKRKQAQEEVAA